MRKPIKKPLFDLSQIQDFRDVFPELTPDQLEIAMLFSLGLSKKEIAAVRGVAPKTIEIMLGTIKGKFDFYTLSNLLSMFQVRLVFFALSECKRHNRSTSSNGNRDEGVAHV